MPWYQVTKLELSCSCDLKNWDSTDMPNSQTDQRQLTRYSSSFCFNPSKNKLGVTWCSPVIFLLFCLPTCPTRKAFKWPSHFLYFLSVFFQPLSVCDTKIPGLVYWIGHSILWNGMLPQSKVEQQLIRSLNWIAVIFVPWWYWGVGVTSCQLINNS